MSYSKRSVTSSNLNLSRLNPDAMAKYQNLVQAAGRSPCPSPEKRLKPVGEERPKRTSEVQRKRTPSISAASENSPRLSTKSTSFPNIEVLTLHQAPLAEDMTPVLNLENESNDGYHHWTAKNGTLIANMLVAAGKYF